MARPRNDPSKEPTAERILRHAHAAFAAKGFEGSSLEDIARAAGVRAPSVLHHYASKELLYEAVLRAFYGDLARSLAAPVLAATVEEGNPITAVLSVLTQLPEADRDLLVTVVTEVVHSGRGADIIADALEQLFTLLGPVIGAELPQLRVTRVRPRLLMASLLVLFSVPSTRTPPGLERLRRLVWAAPDDALPLALELLELPARSTE